MIYPNEFVLICTEPLIKFQIKFDSAVATFETDPGCGLKKNIEIEGLSNSLKVEQDLNNYASENTGINVLLQLC